MKLFEYLNNLLIKYWAEIMEFLCALFIIMMCYALYTRDSRYSQNNQSETAEEEVYIIHTYGEKDSLNFKK